jgi:hypothetical protein
LGINLWSNGKKLKFEINDQIKILTPNAKATQIDKTTKAERFILLFKISTVISSVYIPKILFA